MAARLARQLLLNVSVAVLLLLPATGSAGNLDRHANNPRTDSSSLVDLNHCCNTSQDATAWALVYGIPLIAFANQTTKVFNATGGANLIDTQSELASISSAAVVKPNVDTLYSRVIIDLSQHDLILTVPNITDRFWIFPAYDLFGNNFANISPVNKSLPGKYLLRRADDVLKQPGLERGNKEYQGIVNFPTTYGTMLIRILLKYNTTENLNIVHKYQSEYGIEPTPRATSQPNTPKVPTVTKTLTNGTRAISKPSDILTLLAEVVSFNQPEEYSDRYRVASILGLAGLVNGKYTVPPGVNLDAALITADNTINATITNPKNINAVGNGWELAYPPSEGNFGTNYAPRAYIAQTGYQQLVPYITLYPGYKGGSFSTYTLQPNQSLLFTFSGRPLIKSLGFWSLTVYGANQYLVPNTLNRYEQGDRSNLTYNDGTPVYGPGSDQSITDKPFQVLMQPSDITPPANWTGNWLPAPAGGGLLSFILRWYVPTLALTNGSYVYPKVETIPAITA